MMEYGIERKLKKRGDISRETTEIFLQSYETEYLDLTLTLYLRI